MSMACWCVVSCFSRSSYGIPYSSESQTLLFNLPLLVSWCCSTRSCHMSPRLLRGTPKSLNWCYHCTFIFNFTDGMQDFPRSLHKGLYLLWHSCKVACVGIRHFPFPKCSAYCPTLSSLPWGTEWSPRNPTFAFWFQLHPDELPMKKKEHLHEFNGFFI